MPRFFFHVHDSRDIPDTEGMELANFRAAQIAATKLAGALLADEPSSIWSDDGWSLEVTDANGLVLFTVQITTNLAPALYSEIKPRREL